MSEETLVREQLEKLLANNDPKGDPHAFWGAQYDVGLAWVHFPQGYGGLGITPKLQELVNNELRTAGAPSNFARNPIGIGMGAPVVLTHGSEEQKQRYLRPELRVRRDLVPALQRAGSGLGCGLAVNPGGARRR